MPTYQYRCTECDDALEVVQKFSDDPLTVCPSCQGRLRKVFSAVGVVFKGSGFYKTDSRSSGKRSESPAKTGAADGAAATSTDGAAANGSKKDDSTSGSNSGGSKAPSTSESSSSSGSDGARSSRSPDTPAKDSTKESVHKVA